MIMALTCGYAGLRAMARVAQSNRERVNHYRPLPRGQTPSYPTLPRLRKGIDFTPVSHGVNDWICPDLTAERMALEGPSLTRTVRAGQEPDPNGVSLVAGFSKPRQRILQVGACANHPTSEIAVVPELLSPVEITKAVFT